MPAELQSAREPSGNDASGLQGTTVGGIKPLHRFIKGQPKIAGIIVLILGLSFCIVFISFIGNNEVHMVTDVISPHILQGTLFIVCGILFVLTEHKTSKKTVTISLALSIVAILFGLWSTLQITINLSHLLMYVVNWQYDDEDNTTETDHIDWYSHYQVMGVTLEIIFLVYSLVGFVIFIILSCLAGAALRSTKSQAVIVMTSMPAETPVE